MCGGTGVAVGSGVGVDVGRGVDVEVGVRVFVGVAVDVGVFVADAPPTTPQPEKVAEPSIATIAKAARLNDGRGTRQYRSR